MRKEEKRRTKAKKPNTLRLNDGTIVNASAIYEENTKNFKINDAGTNQIKVSNEKLYRKIYDSCKCYVLYEYNNKHNPLKTFL